MTTARPRGNGWSRLDRRPGPPFRFWLVPSNILALPITRSLAFVDEGVGRYLANAESESKP